MTKPNSAHKSTKNSRGSKTPRSSEGPKNLRIQKDSRGSDSLKSPKPSKPDKSGLLLDAAYELFLEHGDVDISIREIADRAGVAKGTFYLYFRDKDDLRESLIAQKSNELFQRALDALHATDIAHFDEQIIFVINYIINELDANQMALRLIAKNLSLGLFNRKVQDYVVDDKSDIVRSLIVAAKRSGVRLHNPRVLLFMIIELTSSTCFSCILEQRPLSIQEYKPYLFNTIRQMIHAATRQGPPRRPSHLIA